MKKHITLVLFLFVSLSSFNQQTYNTIDVNGISREYYQYLPTGYDPLTESLPVIFALHGIGGTASATSTYGLNQLANTERFIPIYLQGKVNSWNQTSWNNGIALQSDAEDLAFVSNLLDTLNTNLSIDMSRIYMTGISMGAIMTYNVCRHMSDRIAAVVCHIGTMSTEDMNNFNPLFPVPTLHMHGTNDPTVPYNSNPVATLSLVPETIAKLKTTNGWNGDSTVTTIANNANDGITVDRIVYDCTTPLELWRMNDAGHVLLFEPMNDTGSVDVTWGFLKQFTHSSPAAAEISALDAIKPMIYPNPANDHLEFINYANYNSVAIYSIDGKLVLGDIKATGVINLDFLDAGTYLFEFSSNKDSKVVQKIIVQ